MKVALVHDYLREYGGAERVLEAIHEIYPESDVFTSYYFREKMSDEINSWKINVSAVQKLPFLRKFYLYYTYIVPWSFEQFDLRGYDIVISSSSFAAKGVLTYPGQLHICYCHTPPRFLWGINGKSSRRKMIRPILDIFNNFLRKWDFYAGARVDYFVANSMEVSARIKNIYKKDSEIAYPFSVLPVGASGARLPSYYLSVCRLEHVKNVEVIVDAFNELGLPLKLAGSGVLLEKIKNMAKGNIEVLGFVKEEELAQLYEGAIGFIACATDEDFGMTVVEAQSMGVPIIALRRGGYVETVIDGVTGVFFESAIKNDLVHAVRKFEKMEFDEKLVKQNALRFSKAEFMIKFKNFVDTKLKVSNV